MTNLAQETPKPPRPIAFTSTSGHIVAITYSDDDMQLFVQFKGGTYVYRQVPSDVADAITNAPSAGKYLNEFIKGQYEFERIG